MSASQRPLSHAAIKVMSTRDVAEMSLLDSKFVGAGEGRMPMYRQSTWGISRWLMPAKWRARQPDTSTTRVGCCECTKFRAENNTKLRRTICTGAVASLNRTANHAAMLEVYLM